MPLPFFERKLQFVILAIRRRHYLRQGGYVSIGVYLFVRLLAGIRKNYVTDFHKIRWKGGTWAAEETVRFWW